MKHLTFADKSLITGDDAADLIVEYAAVLAQHQDADTVDINAYSSDGQQVSAKLLLDVGAPVMAETTNTDLPEPDNAEAVTYMREQIMRRTAPVAIEPSDVTMPSHYDELDL
jgi:ethanolamine utilization protein EutP (predicted NTPase)